MSIRFRIRNISEKATKEGDAFVRFSGKAEPYSQGSEREVQLVGVDGAGNPTLVFNTGLDKDRVEFYRWYSKEEQEEVVKQIEEHLPTLEKAFGGPKILDNTNKFFWKNKREVAKLAITHETENFEFDTKNPLHAILYFSVISGAFMDIVAPTKDWAESHGIFHYLQLETDDNQFEGEEDITRGDAYFELGKLRQEESMDALFILAWCLQYDTTSFGAYTKSTSQRNLINYHMQFIDGKLKPKKISARVNFPKVFLDYVKKWEGQQTRPKLYTEAYVKAGEYYSFINQKEKKFVTVDGTVLGNTIKEAVENLHKTKFTQDLENLRERVEAKWKE